MLIPIVVAYAVAGVLAPGLRRLPVPRLPRLVGPAGLVLEGIGLAARTIAALLTPRDQVIAPIIAGVRSPRMAQTHHLDPGRPRLRNPAHRPANPLHPPRHHHNPGSSGIDNTLSIGISQVSRLTAASPGRVARARGDQAAAGERNEVVQNAPPDGDHK